MSILNSFLDKVVGSTSMKIASTDREIHQKYETQNFVISPIQGA